MIDFIKELAVEAGELILKTSNEVVQDKGDGFGDVLTLADTTSENFVISKIKERFPGHEILAEESVPVLADAVNKPALWVIDPLDGTTNFSFGLPLYNVAIAYLEFGEVKKSAVYDPNRKELFWAEKDKGAYAGNSQISVRPLTSLHGALSLIGSPHKIADFDQTYPMAKILHERGARIMNLGSAELSFSYIAAGRLGLLYEWGLKPWDVAAGKLLLEEAGGKLMFLEDSHLFDTKAVLAGVPVLVDEAYKLLISNKLITH